jgi:carbon storage regulator
MGKLVITRERRQSVMIGDDIQVTVEEIRSGTVRISFDAPRHIVVDRLEVWARKKVEAGQAVPPASREKRGELPAA